MAISGKCVAAFRAGQIAEQEVYVPSPVKAAGEAIKLLSIEGYASNYANFAFRVVFRLA